MTSSMEQELHEGSYGSSHETETEDVKESDTRNTKGNVSCFDSPNVIVISDAGKPLFIRYNTASDSGDSDNDAASSAEHEERIALVCGMIQAIRASIQNDERLGYNNDITCINADTMKLVFMTAGSLTFVSILSIPNTPTCPPPPTDAYLQMQLEYIYGLLIFTLTDHVQTMLHMNPNMDLRSLIGSAEESMRGILDESDIGVGRQRQRRQGEEGYENWNCGPYLMSGIEVVSPIPLQDRMNCSRILSSACRNNNDTIFAILSIDHKIVNMIQPKNSQHHIRHSDLRILLHYIHSHDNSKNNARSSSSSLEAASSPYSSSVMELSELWFPICLPRLNKSSFVYAYHSCIDPEESKLNLTIINQQGSTEQFALLQQTAKCIRQELGLLDSETKESVLRIYDLRKKENEALNMNMDNKLNSDHNTSHAREGNADLNFLWERTTQLESSQSSTSYNNDAMVSNFAEIQSGIASSPERIHQKMRMCCDEKFKQRKSITMARIRDAIAKDSSRVNNSNNVLKNYCESVSAYHFTFSYNVQVEHYKTGKPSGGVLTQCINAPFHDDVAQNDILKANVWLVYQKLSLELLDNQDPSTVGGLNAASNRSGQGSSSIDCPALCLHESILSSCNRLFFLKGTECFVTTSQPNCKLFVTFPGSIKEAEAFQRCDRLIDSLLQDKDMLFISHPLSF